MKIKKFRDLTIIDMENKKLVIACDSSGAVGDKEFDIVKTEPEIVGYYATHVAMAEIISYGAKPIVVVNTLSVEMNNTGKKIINGIKKLLKEINIEENIITGSTEENFPTVQTGIGVTIIGITNKGIEFVSNKNDYCVAIGIPRVGEEVLKSRDIVTIKDILKIRNLEFVHEMIPVGSKGITHEIKEIEKSGKYKFVFNKNIKIDLSKSAGPSTCVLVTLKKENIPELKKAISLPVVEIGKLV
ncbi:selenophosphate synthase-like enzyme [Marinitoga piezophila KA3]|uniref:Selenophosphate synthase-like enzyme n=1 Tax=Marinitoga piezophila (strain DSM 14283 / JCM 11233 / KA3) TaxID=443254 RepID=H2J520_MARPK|nr:AIR synthase related protein [Marinitoga piezophila]AEX86037.1 selenophosphate synthase-like enzyme [Marinitoga piezophila KA3]